MRYNSYVFVFLLVLLSPLSSLANDISYTLEDRDRLIKVEANVEQMVKRFEQVDKRFEQIDNRIERLENVMMCGFGLLFTTMIGLVGFVLWDRRTALSPAIRESKELRDREERLERALKEFAEKEPRLAEALRHANLMG